MTVLQFLLIQLILLFSDSSRSKKMFKNEVKLLMTKTQETIGTHIKDNPDWLIEGDLIPDKFSSFSTLNYWPSRHIDFIVDGSLSTAHKDVIYSAMRHWERFTCLKFNDQTKNRSFDESNDHILFVGSTDGCFAEVGRSGGRQFLNIGPDCAHESIVIHEIGHAVGLNHEHSRNDRDQSVIILTENIKREYINNFKKRNQQTFDTEYDYNSIMHYDYSAFSKDKYEHNAIISLDPNYQYVIGLGKSLSFKDQKLINKIYTCTDLCQKNVSCLNNGFVDDRCRCVCPDGTAGSNCENKSEIEDPVCGGRILKPLVLETPGYPSRELDWKDRSCVYQIKASEDQYVMITFIDFKFHRRYFGHCVVEHVEIRINGAKSQGKFYCGEDLKDLSLQSRKNELLILINSYHGKVNIERGFKADIKFMKSVEMSPQLVNTDKNVECSLMGLISSLKLPVNGSMILTSKNFGKMAYKHNDVCGAVIKAKAGESIKVEFEYLDIEDSRGCINDHLDILDSSNQIIASYCGSKLPSPGIITFEKITVLFTSDDVLEGKGFKVRFQSVNSSGQSVNKVACEGYKVITLETDSSVEMISPFFGTKNYPNNYECQVTVKVNHGHTIILDILEFKIEQSETCSYDSLTLLDLSSNQIGKFCGFLEPVNYIIGQQTLRIIFKSDFMFGDKGFRIKFTAIKRLT